MTQHDSDIMYMRIAEVIARQSKATRAKVAAVLVKDGNIISFGFNGTPSGFDNTCEYWDEAEEACKTKPEVLHAESNALMKLVKHGGPGSNGATMYVTFSPCIECSKMIIQAGIARVCYLYDYRKEDGMNLLKQAGIELCKLSESEVYAEEPMELDN